MKRIFTVLMILVISISLFTGCSGKEDTPVTVISLMTEWDRNSQGLAFDVSYDIVMKVSGDEAVRKVSTTGDFTVQSVGKIIRTVGNVVENDMDSRSAKQVDAYAELQGEGYYVVYEQENNRWYKSESDVSPIGDMLYTTGVKYASLRDDTVMYNGEDCYAVDAVMDVSDIGMLMGMSLSKTVLSEEDEYDDADDDTDDDVIYVSAVYYFSVTNRRLYAIEIDAAAAIDMPLKKVMKSRFDTIVVSVDSFKIMITDIDANYAAEIVIPAGIITGAVDIADKTETVE